MIPLVRRSLALAGVLVSLALPAAAQWSPDSNVNNPVVIATDTQSPAIAVSDGAGGTIVVWKYARFDAGTFTFFYSARAQRLDAVGNPMWAAGGVALADETLHALSTLVAPPMAAVADGAGGAIVAWRDIRNDTGDIFAQRITGAGALAWGPTGLAIAAAPGNQLRPNVIADGAGGAILTWQDPRAGFGNTDVYAQRVNAAGVPQWTANGVGGVHRVRRPAPAGARLGRSERRDPRLVGHAHQHPADLRAAHRRCDGPRAVGARRRAADGDAARAEGTAGAGERRRCRRDRRLGGRAERRRQRRVRAAPVGRRRAAVDRERGAGGRGRQRGDAGDRVGRRGRRHRRLDGRAERCERRLRAAPGRGGRPAVDGERRHGLRCGGPARSSRPPCRTARAGSSSAGRTDATVRTTCSRSASRPPARLSGPPTAGRSRRQRPTSRASPWRRTALAAASSPGPTPATPGPASTSTRRT